MYPYILVFSGTLAELGLINCAHIYHSVTQPCRIKRCMSGKEIDCGFVVPAHVYNDFVDFAVNTSHHILVFHGELGQINCDHVYHSTTQACRTMRCMSGNYIYCGFSIINHVYTDFGNDIAVNW